MDRYWKEVAAVSCSHDAYWLGGVGMRIWLMGKLGRACVGAWVGAWYGAWHGAWVHGGGGVVIMWWYG